MQGNNNRDFLTSDQSLGLVLGRKYLSEYNTAIEFGPWKLNLAFMEAINSSTGLASI